MGTRALIAIKNDNDSDIESLEDLLNRIESEYLFKSIMVSFDGYPSNIYQKLKNIMKNNDINVIIANGDIRSLHNNYSPNPLGFHTTEYPQTDVCIVYSRDGEKQETPHVKLVNLKNRKNGWNIYEDYTYVITPYDIYVSDATNKAKFKSIEDYIKTDEGELDE